MTYFPCLLTLGVLFHIMTYFLTRHNFLLMLYLLTSCYTFWRCDILLDVMTYPRFMWHTFSRHGILYFLHHDVLLKSWRTLWVMAYFLYFLMSWRILTYFPYFFDIMKYFLILWRTFLLYDIWCTFHNFWSDDVIRTFACFLILHFCKHFDDVSIHFLM